MTGFELRYRIDMYKVRALCIRENYYTRGDNDDYEHMLLEMCEGDRLEDLEEIAEDIVDHSDVHELRMKYDTQDVEETVLEYLLNECCWIMPIRSMRDPVGLYTVDELLEALVRAKNN